MQNPFEEGDTAFAVHAAVPISSLQQVTTKIPPAFDGRTSWFAYEDLIDEWCDVTELDPDKRGPALRNRLDGEAATYKALFDRERLKDAATGVEYFKTELRKHFVKGAQSVYLWRLLHFFHFRRGQNDFLRWLGKVQVLRKRLAESWMDTMDPYPAPNSAEARAFARTVLQEAARQNVDPRSRGTRDL